MNTSKSCTSRRGRKTNPNIEEKLGLLDRQPVGIEPQQHLPVGRRIEIPRKCLMSGGRQHIQIEFVYRIVGVHAAGTEGFGQRNTALPWSWADCRSSLS